MALFVTSTRSLLRFCPESTFCLAKCHHIALNPSLPAARSFQTFVMFMLLSIPGAYITKFFRAWSETCNVFRLAIKSTR